MDFRMILNELSFVQTAPDIQTAQERMTGFINLLSYLRIEDVKKTLHTHHEFYTTLLAANYSISKWLQDKNVDREKRRFFKNTCN